MTRKRWLGLLVAALIVPLPAFALTSGSSSASLGVSVSNGGCGVAGGSAVVCQLQVSFSPIDGATRYTATVTAPDGSVVDYGSVGAGGATIPAPYVGDGDYSVTISAWGAKPEPRAPQAAGHRLERPRRARAPRAGDGPRAERHPRAQHRCPARQRNRYFHRRRATARPASAPASTPASSRPTRADRQRADLRAAHPGPAAPAPALGHGVGRHRHHHRHHARGSARARLPGPQDPTCCTAP